MGDGSNQLGKAHCALHVATALVLAMTNSPLSLRLSPLILNAPNYRYVIVYWGWLILGGRGGGLILGDLYTQQTASRWTAKTR